MNPTMFLFADMFSEVTPGITDDVFTIAKSSLSGNPSAYIQKGERIKTLARDHFEQQALNLSDIAKKLFQKPFCNIYNVEDLLNEISKRVVRPVLRNLDVCADLSVNEQISALKTLTPHIQWGLFTYSQMQEDTVFDHPKKWFPAAYQEDGLPNHWLKASPEDDVLYLCSELFPGIIICGTRCRKLSREKYFNQYPRLNVIDLAYCISFMIFCSAVWDGIVTGQYTEYVSYKKMRINALRSMGSYPYSGINEENGLLALDNRLIIVEFPPVGFQDTCHDRRMRTAFSYPDETGIDQVRRYFLQKGCRVYFISNDASPYDETAALCGYITRQTGIDFEAAFRSYQYAMPHDKITFLKQWLDDCGNAEMAPVCMRYMDVFLYALSDLANNHSSETAAMMIGMVRETDPQKSKLDLYSGDFFYSSNSWFPFSDFKPVTYFLSLFLETCREYKNIIKTAHTQSSHARAFETKKAIPKKILNRMETSILNRYFGYVEYDSSCDLDKIGIIERQIVAFLDAYFPDIDLSTISIRFRRIGHMGNINGLYYISEKCICLSVDHVSSFTHEFAHCYDYLHGCLSDTHRHDEFLPVYERYCNCLKTRMNRDEEMRKRMQHSFKGSTYADYCMEEAEVFARCFEMFCRDELHIDCSICKEDADFTFAYPEDHLLRQLINDYYSQLFKSRETVSA